MGTSLRSHTGCALLLLPQTPAQWQRGGTKGWDQKARVSGDRDRRVGDLEMAQCVPRVTRVGISSHHEISRGRRANPAAVFRGGPSEVTGLREVIRWSPAIESWWLHQRRESPDRHRQTCPAPGPVLALRTLQQKATTRCGPSALDLCNCEQNKPPFLIK